MRAKSSAAAREQVLRQGGVPNARKFTSQRVRGAANWKWKDGASIKARGIRASFEYAEWRKAVFERDDYTCQQCDVRGARLHAHHLKPFALHPELRLDVSNGQTLCERCHHATRSYRRGTNWQIMEAN